MNISQEPFTASSAGLTARFFTNPPEPAENASEEHTEPLEQEGIPSTRYTWEIACKDLALLSHLTLNESADLIWPLRQLDYLDPYTVMPHLQKMILAIRHNSYREAAAHLARVVEEGVRSVRVQASEPPEK